MKRIGDRRDPAAYKLRVYMDAIKDAKAMTDEQWMDNWVKHCTVDSVYILRDQWIHYLEACALSEAETIIDYKEEAA